MTEVQKLAKEIDRVAKLYEELFLRVDDIKSLQGMERCIELKMKICGLDAKQCAHSVEKQQIENSILLSELPTEVLKQLLEILNHQIMKKLKTTQN